MHTGNVYSKRGQGFPTWNDLRDFIPASYDRVGVGRGYLALLQGKIPRKVKPRTSLWTCTCEPEPTPMLVSRPRAP